MHRIQRIPETVRDQKTLRQWWEEFPIANRSGNQESTEYDQSLLSDPEILDLISAGLANDIGLTPLKGFKLDFSANPGFRKVFFSASCQCGTAALLSVEISKDKTNEEISQAVPSLLDRLERQAKAFRAMSCDMHKRMNLGISSKR